MSERHPSWFKMKLERRELVRQLSPETAVNVLLACWEFLETGEKPASLSPIESVAFSAFMPDMDEAWKRYLQRVSNGTQGGRPKGEKPYGSICPQAEPYGTEEETETDSILLRNIERECVADKPPTRPRRFTPPSVEQVQEYCQERKNNIDAALFVDHYQARGWKLNGGQTMKDWKAAVRTWERRDKSSPPEQPPTAPRTTYHTEVINGEEVDVPDA